VGETQRERERERKRETERHRETEREAQRDTKRDTERQSDRHRDTDTQRHRDTKRGLSDMGGDRDAPHVARTRCAAARPKKPISNLREMAPFNKARERERNKQRERERKGHCERGRERQRGIHHLARGMLARFVRARATTKI
jgi:hypothetical protein